jgi:hypothetical protein
MAMISTFARQEVSERGIGVQISGDGNTVVVYAGMSELHLVRKHTRKAEPKTELQLLRVDLRATSLVGRQTALVQLEDWLALDQTVLMRCITGRAGAGKTRLAIELCEYAQQMGWTAGFVQYGQFQEFIKHAAAWRWNTPTLVVIDYASALARDLRRWLEVLARPESQAHGKKLRLLLLERHAERDLGWWADLLRPVSFSDPAPDELVDAREPVSLPSLTAIEDRRALLAEAMRLTAKIARVDPAPAPPSLGVNADFDRRLGNEAINNEPLYLIMAGVEAITTDAPAVLALSRTDLAERAANREIARLARLASAWGFPEQLVVHLAMSVTLQGGCTVEDALQLVSEEREAMSFSQTSPATDVVNRLADALPRASGTDIDAIRPDLIGEAFLLLGMKQLRRFPTVQTEIVERAWRRAGNEVTTTLVRTALDYARGDADHVSLVWLRHLVEKVDNWAVLWGLADALPEQTLALRELAALVEQRIAMAVAEQAKKEANLQPALARVYVRFAKRLSDLGQREPALAAAQEAVNLYRQLATQRLDAFRPDLAGSLNNLAVMLSDLGQRKPALAAAQEVVKLYRELAAQRPDAFWPDLAMSLNNLANRLRDLGQHQPALAAAQGAVKLYRELATQRPDAFRPDLAMSLNNLANKLRDLGQREPALAAAQEAVKLYRELATQRPDAFRPDLAMSLNNLAAMLSDLGQREPALAAAQEAVAIRRELAAQRPDAFRPDLAMSLNNLAVMLSDLGQREPALAAAQEAVNHYRELAAQRPDAFQPHLAGSLYNFANRLSDLSEREPALAAAQEAVAIRRELATQRPDAFRPDLAMSLNNLAGMLRDLGQREPAAAAAQEAVKLYRELAAQRPDAFRPNLAISLALLADCLDALKQAEEALQTNVAAIANLSHAFVQHPVAYRHWMNAMLQQYVQRCERLQRPLDEDLLGPVIGILHLQNQNLEEDSAP